MKDNYIVTNKRERRSRRFISFNSVHNTLIEGSAIMNSLLLMIGSILIFIIAYATYVHGWLNNGVDPSRNPAHEITDGLTMCLLVHQYY